MPLKLRKAHLALWLALVLANWTVGVFTLWGDGLILDVPATIVERIFMAVLDVIFFFNGILAAISIHGLRMWAIARASK